VRFDSQNQVQSNSVDLSKGLESIATMEYIKRISFGSPDSPRSARTRNNKTIVPEEAAWLRPGLATSGQTFGAADPTFLFYRFVHKIQTVNPFSISFSPMCSIHLTLSYFTGKIIFSHPKTAYPKLTYFPKTLKNQFYSKSQFPPKRFLTTTQ